MNNKLKVFLFSMILVLSLATVLYLSQHQPVDKHVEISTDNPSPVNQTSPIPSNVDLKNNRTRKITLGASMLGLNEFPAAIAKKMVQEAKEKGAEIIIYDGKDSAWKQLSDVKELIEKKVDIIILNPVDADRSAMCVELAEKANIPILGVNAVVNKSDKLLTYVGSNDLEAGEIEMKFIAERIKGEGNVVIINGVTGQSSQIQRTQGILNILRGYPNIKILEEKTGNWSREEGYELIKKWYEKHGNKISAIVSQNDEMALGAIRFLEEKKLIGTIPIVGVDAIPDALQAVKEGKLDATVFQDAEGQGKLAVDLAIKIINNESIARTYYIPFRLVTKENISQYTKN